MSENPVYRQRYLVSTMWRNAVNRLRGIGSQASKRAARPLPSGEDLRQGLTRRLKIHQGKARSKWDSLRGDVRQRVSRVTSAPARGRKKLQDQAENVARRAAAMTPKLPSVSGNLPSFRSVRNLVFALSFCMAFGFGFGKALPHAMANAYVELAKLRNDDNNSRGESGRGKDAVRVEKHDGEGDKEGAGGYTFS